MTKRLASKRIDLQVNLSPESHYYQLGKLGILNEANLQQFDNSFISTRKWAIILGPSFIGQAEISKYINDNKYAEVIDYNKFIERKKKELAGPEEDELEELPFPRMIQELKKELDNGDKTKDLIFNGFDGWGEGANVNQ